MTTVPTPERAMVIGSYQPAESPVLASALVNLGRSLHQAAVNNVRALAEQEQLTETEIQAMTLVEELRQVNGLDLAAVLMRAELLRKIERTNALANHPAGYANLQEMARGQGISVAELSQTLDLANVIFPYVQDTLGMPIAQLWEEIGKSNMRELVPVLKTIITGEASPTASVNQSVERLLNDTAATLRAAGAEIDEQGNFEIEQPTPDGGRTRIRRNLRQNAVEELLEAGQLLTNRELRTRIRPERTPSINASVISVNGNRTVIMDMTAEQFEMLMRRAGSCLDPQVFQLPEDSHQRQIEAARIPEIRALLRLLEG